MLGEHGQCMGKAGARLQQGLDLARLGKLIQAAQGGQHPLPGLAVLAAILDDLEVGVGARSLLAEEHGASLLMAPPF